LHGTSPGNRIFAPEVLASAGKAFVAMDRILDGTPSGPSYLRIPEIAELVVTALPAGEGRFGRYQIHSYVAMPNHVHALMTPHVVATEWLGPLKGFTAHEANRILGQRGGHFWQRQGSFGGQAHTRGKPPKKAAAAKIGCPTSLSPLMTQ
jgi:hypothetical protein